MFDNTFSASDASPVAQPAGAMSGAQFLDRVVAPGNFIAIAFATGKGGMAHQFFPHNDVAGAAGFVGWCVREKLDCWYGVASYAHAEPDAKGRYRGKRTQDNVQALKAFWIDIDVKREGDKKAADKVYADIPAAVAWLKGFLVSTGLPQPNLWVHSGYGLHVYWVLEDVVSPEAWQPYADALKAALIQHNATLDVGLSADSARILRIPGTFNLKDKASPAPVEVLKTEADIPNTVVLDALQPYVGTATAKTLKQAASQAIGAALAGAPPAVMAQRQNAPQGAATMTRAAQDMPSNRRDHYFAQIAERCEQVKASLANHGAGDPYPLWYLGHLSLAAFCDDGDKFVHQIGKGDPRYDHAKTDEAFEQALHEKDTKGIGAPTCAHFERARPGLCQTCPHFGKVSTPYSLGVADDPAPSAPQYISFGRFNMNSGGLFYEDEAAGDGEKPKRAWLSGPFEVMAITRDGDSKSWGIHLCWHDPDGRLHEWSMPKRMLAGAKDELFGMLLDGGLNIASDTRGRNKLGDYLSGVKVSARARAVPRAGWHPGEKGPVFVTPDRTYGDTGGEHVLLQTEARLDAPFRVSSTVENWRDNIGVKCAGNSRLVLGVSAAFAAPLLHLAGEESGGLHLFGPSRLGKTTELRVAGSVWDGGGINGPLRSWRVTSNGLEGIAAAHCDALLCLDEMGQVDAREAGEIAYMLANGSGKGRADRKGSVRRRTEWRLMLLSTGEITLGDKMAELGRKPKAGQEVRLINIPADAGAGLGIFENLHGAASPGEFAEQLKGSTQHYYGAPIRRFLERLTEINSADPAKIPGVLAAARTSFLAAHLSPSSSGQVRSVCGRFALIAAAGQLATEFGITGWPDGEAERSAAVCFQAWLGQRGTSGDHDIEAGIRQVIAFVEAHGSSRFEDAWRAGGPERVLNRVGFRRIDGQDWEYMILPEQWRSEVTKGFDSSAVAQEMMKRGLLQPDNSGKTSKTVAVPGYGKLRLYVLAPGILR